MRQLQLCPLLAVALVAWNAGAVSQSELLSSRAPWKTDTGIAWFGTWQAGLAEARRSGRPIFLVAAAPHCRNISGIW